MLRSVRPWYRRPLATSVLLVLAALFALAVPKDTSASSVIVVDGDGHATQNDCNAADAAPSSIQDAVNLAAAGDTILVCPGIYGEQVEIAKSGLTIARTGLGEVAIRPGTVLNNGTRPSNGAPVAAIVLVDKATGVTLTGITVDGSLADSGASSAICGIAPFYAGIYFQLASGKVDSTHVTGIRSDGGCSFGILVQTDNSGTGATANVDISNNTIEHYGTGGIMCGGQSTFCNITDNTVLGEGPVVDQLQFGIMVRAEASAQIRGNTISGHQYLPGNGVVNWSVGIFLVYADPKVNPHLLQDNVFSGNQLNVQRLSTAAAWD